MPNESLAVRRRRLLYRAGRRGFKEADLLIGGFARARLAGMSADELNAFEALIALPDAELYGLISSESPPARFEGPVLRAMRAFHRRAD